MFGLTMHKTYLVEILTGKKTFDARPYDTWRRGKILLIDSRTMNALGMVELVGSREISPEEYAAWHCTGEWANAVMQVDMNKKYYAWDFADPVLLSHPIKVKEKKKTWVFVEDKLI